MVELNFLQAQIEQVDHFVELMIMSGEDFFKALFGPRLREVLRKLYVEKSNLFSHERCVFATVGQNIVGMMLAYSGEYARKYKLRTGRLLFKLLHLSKLIWLATLDRKFQRLEENEFYLSNFAVYPQYRSQGFGKRMLLYCFEWARRSACSKVSLDVEKNNLVAVGLYTKMGFKTEREFVVKLANQGFEFVRMSRPL